MEPVVGRMGFDVRRPRLVVRRLERFSDRLRLVSCAHQAPGGMKTMPSDCPRHVRRRFSMPRRRKRQGFNGKGPLRRLHEPVVNCTGAVRACPNMSGGEHFHDIARA